MEARFRLRIRTSLVVRIYGPRLLPLGIRMHILPAAEANRLISELGIAETRATKVDLFSEGQLDDQWRIFGVAGT